MSKLNHVDLSPAECEKLETLVKKRSSGSEAVKRSHILLAANRSGAKNWTDAQIADYYKVSIRTIERIRERYITEGLTISLSGKPRLNLDKIRFDEEVEARLTALRCSEPVAGHRGWTLQLLADKMVELCYVESSSHESVRQLLNKTRSSPGG